MNTDKKRTRLDTTERRKQIQEAAVRVAERTDYRMMTREQIGEEAGCTPALVSSYFGDMPEIREMVVRHALARRILVIIGQAIAARDPLVRRLDMKTRLEVLTKYLGTDIPAAKN